MALKPTVSLAAVRGGILLARPGNLLYGVGAGLLTGCLTLAVLSPAFEYGMPLNDHPIVLLITVCTGLGLITFPLFLLVPKLQDTNRLLFAAIGIGIAARLLFLPTAPIYEDDFYRYLWDGAVTANGIDPFKYPPSDFIPQDDALVSILGKDPPPASDEMETLSKLADESASVIERINYPYIKTNYPIVAQTIFAVSYAIGPWSLIVWRLICFAFELMALFFLIRSLEALSLSRVWVLVYWWNPIAIIEIANRAHMDALILPALAATIFYAATQRPIIASAALSTAVGIKFWPALLFPVLFRSQLGDVRKLLGMSAVAFLLCSLFLLPQLPNGLESNSGLVTYSQSWQTNSFAFSQIERFLTAVGIADADLTTRFFVFALVSLCAVAAALPKLQDAQDLIARMLLVTTALFLLSPTQYPWYFLWVLPFLVFIPLWPLLAIPVTLPLYFSRYHFIDAQQAEFFDNVIVPLEFVPIFAALTVWLWQRRALIPERLHAA